MQVGKICPVPILFNSVLFWFCSILVGFGSGSVLVGMLTSWWPPPQKKPETALLLDLNLHGGIGDLNDVQKGSLLGWRV